MEFATDINDKKIDLYFYEDGHKVGDFSLTKDETIALLKKLMIAICRYDSSEVVTFRLSMLEKGQLKGK